MDISAACTGFVYALDVAAGYFARKRVKKVLIAAGDTMTRLVNWQDRSTCVLFGDGAGAVVLGEGDSAARHSPDLRRQHRGAEYPPCGRRQPL